MKVPYRAFEKVTKLQKTPTKPQKQLKTFRKEKNKPVTIFFVNCVALHKKNHIIVISCKTCKT